MRSTVCPRCRHLNYLAAVACKRCGYQLARSLGGGSDWPAPQGGPAPPKSLGILLAILGATLSFAGVYLLAIGGRTPYFVVAGVGIAASGVLVAAGKQAGVSVYWANFVLMLVWSALETDGEARHMVPRLFLPALIGLYLLSDKVRSRLK